MNRGPDTVGVVAWLTLVTGSGRRVAGPRAAQVDLPELGVATLTLGPVFATVDTDATVALIAQREPGSAGVVATEGTDYLNRAGATGILVWGGPGVFQSGDLPPGEAD